MAESRRALRNALIGDAIIIFGAIWWAIGLSAWAAISIIALGAVLAVASTLQWVHLRRRSRQ